MARLGAWVAGVAVVGAALGLACGEGDDPSPTRPLEGGGVATVTPSVTVVREFEGSPRDSDLPVADVLGADVRAPLPAPWAQPPRASGIAAPEVSALAAVIVDEASGAVLFEKDGFRPLPPASLTKVATAIVALEHVQDLSADVVTDVNAAQMPSSTSMGLMPGDRFTLRDLLYGLLLPSGNDAALAVGRYVSGSDAAFVSAMNALLYRMGMDSSHFSNPHGLGSRNHVVSARDMAMLARYAMTFPEYRAIIRSPSFQAVGSRVINVGSLNALTFSYPGADSSKIGYTRSAGPSVVASATRNGHRLYVVVLNSAARDADAARLLDWAFANHTWE